MTVPGDLTRVSHGGHPKTGCRRELSVDTANFLGYNNTTDAAPVQRKVPVRQISLPPSEKSEKR